LEHLYIAIFNERQEDVFSKYNDSPSCGGSGSMLSLRPNGQFYPCIRYMPTSVGNNVKDLCIGTIETGIVGREQDSEILKMMDDITRRSYSNDICYECPLSNDCGSCTALGHTVFGTPNKKATFICIQMIAEALANVYYWNNLSLKHPEYDLPVRKNVVPDEWALLVIDQEELDNLKLLECMTISIKIDHNLN
jgi:radical SAM protein with 4Fe4S-binding SPASM domain